jgi:hypothetical protein
MPDTSASETKLQKETLGKRLRQSKTLGKANTRLSSLTYIGQIPNVKSENSQRKTDISRESWTQFHTEDRYYWGRMYKQMRNVTDSIAWWTEPDEGRTFYTDEKRLNKIRTI